MNHDEIERIQQVYRDYSDANLGATRWSPSNAGNQQIVAERRSIVAQILQHHGYSPLEGRRVFDIGCGGGDVLADFGMWGAHTRCLYGLELLAERAQAAHQRHPELSILQGDAGMLSFDDNVFDLVVFFTVFSSVLSQPLRQQIAAEAVRVLRPGGAVVWYDLRVPSPGNPNIRPLGRPEIAALFPRLTPYLQTATLLPPLARRLGKLTTVMYSRLAAIPWLHTHYIGLLVDEHC